jgi:hypothetical protein
MYYIADITSDIYYYKTFWDNTDYDNRQFDRKILCRTKEEAIELTKKMLECAKGDE